MEEGADVDVASLIVSVYFREECELGVACVLGFNGMNVHLFQPDSYLITYNDWR